MKQPCSKKSPDRHFNFQKKLGIAAILGASLMWAIEPNFAKLAFATSGVIQTSAVRGAVTTFTALFYVLVVRRKGLGATGGQLARIAYIALSGTIVADLLFFYALTMIPIVNAVLIAHMQPVFIVLIGFIVLKEDRLTKYDYIGILVLIVAGLLVSTRTPENLATLKLGTFGDLVVLGATFAWATAGIVMRKYLRDMDAGVITFYRFAMASAVLAIIVLVQRQGISINIYQILVGVVAGTGYILYYEGLKRIKAAQASALELSTPFFAALLGFLILGEVVTFMQMLGIGSLFLGVYFMSKKENLHVTQP